MSHVILGPVLRSKGQKSSSQYQLTASCLLMCAIQLHNSVMIWSRKIECG